MNTTPFYLGYIVGTISFYLGILSQAWNLLWFKKIQKGIMKTSYWKNARSLFTSWDNVLPCFQGDIIIQSVLLIAF